MRRLSRNVLNRSGKFSAHKNVKTLLVKKESHRITAPLPYEPIPIDTLKPLPSLKNLTEESIDNVPEEFRDFNLTMAYEETRKIHTTGRRRAANLVENEIDSVISESHLKTAEELVKAINRATTLGLGTSDTGNELYS